MKRKRPAPLSVIRNEARFDTHPEVSLDFSHVKAQLAQGYSKPFLLLDSAIVRQKARRFIAAMPRVKPHYAMKANPHPQILRTLIEEGAGFEIASIAELDLLLSLGVPATEIFYSNPMKARASIIYAAAKGVEWYVLDSVEELHKIHSIKADAKLYVRIDTSNVGSDWPLSGKFGAFPDAVTEIIQQAAKLRADLAGITFHVGSQCLNLDNWLIGIKRAKEVFTEMRAAGLTPRLLNIGGGFPVRHVKPIPSIEVIGEAVQAALADFPKSVQVIAEPGRYLVSDAGYFVCRVIGTAKRGEKHWIYWDAGVFGGVIETTEGLKYDILTDNHRIGRMISWTVAGPTCDSVDICTREQFLPEDLQEGDFIYIKNAGAYTSAYASNFNGFPLPEVIVM